MLKRELAAQLLDLRAQYEQACADNVRLRTERDALREDNVRLRMRLDDALEHGPTPVAHAAEGVDLNPATLKRIAIKCRTSCRYNRDVRQYEVYRDGVWVSAPRA